MLGSAFLNVSFMIDGKPAESQAIWESPWGKIGICICYDLSYTRVTDELVRQGMEPYNRLFNGIGWSLLDADTWPQTEFDARHTYFSQHEAALTEQAGHACAPQEARRGSPGSCVVSIWLISESSLMSTAETALRVKNPTALVSPRFIALSLAAMSS